MRSIGDHFIQGYAPIVERRKNHPFGTREKDFQLYRRGRYVEFNLVYDRGTLFGLQSGGAPNLFSCLCHLKCTGNTIGSQKNSVRKLSCILISFRREIGYKTCSSGSTVVCC